MMSDAVIHNASCIIHDINKDAWIMSDEFFWWLNLVNKRFLKNISSPVLKDFDVQHNFVERSR